MEKRNRNPLGELKRTSQRLLKAGGRTVYTLQEVREIVHTALQGIPLELSITHAIEFLIENKVLAQIRLEFPRKPVVRFVHGKATGHELAQSISAQGYFSHFTAVDFHGLTIQVPKITYFNIEQERRAGGGTLSQEAVERVFAGKSRVSNNVATYEDRRICILEGANTECLGVDRVRYESAFIRVANVERTLVDIAVRPIYAGGVYEVQRIYEAAKERANIATLHSYLLEIGYTYPYHQVIGFYLEKAGYSEDCIERFRRMHQNIDFFLDYGIKQKAYIARWRLFVPKLMQ